MENDLQILNKIEPVYDFCGKLNDFEYLEFIKILSKTDNGIIRNSLRDIYKKNKSPTQPNVNYEIINVIEDDICLYDTQTRIKLNNYLPNGLYVGNITITFSDSNDDIDLIEYIDLTVGCNIVERMYSTKNLLDTLNFIYDETNNKYQIKFNHFIPMIFEYVELNIKKVSEKPINISIRADVLKFHKHEFYYVGFEMQNYINTNIDQIDKSLRIYLNYIVFYIIIDFQKKIDLKKVDIILGTLILSSIEHDIMHKFDTIYIIPLCRSLYDDDLYNYGLNTSSAYDMKLKFDTDDDLPKTANYYAIHNNIFCAKSGYFGQMFLR